MNAFGYPLIASGYILANIGLGAKHQAVKGCTVTQGIPGTNSILLDPEFAGYSADRLRVLCTAGIGSAAIAGSCTFRMSTIVAGLFVVDTLRGDTLAAWDGPWSFTVFLTPLDR